MPPYMNMTDSHPQYYSDGGGPSSSSPPRSHHHPSSSSTSRPRQRLPLHHAHSNVETRDELLQLAAMELEAMRSPRTTKGGSGNNNNNNTSTTLPQCCQGASSTSSSSSSSQSEEMERSFPTACLHLLRTLPNNTKCHDCQSSCDATWASVSYGITLCLQCSGKHRGLGVQTSFIKSLTLDSWKRREILCMLEGGNEQLGLFFDRHGMGGGSCSVSGNNIIMEGVGGLDRYRTKAASFYRQHLLSHAKTVAGKGGLYEGREASRKSSTPKQRQRKTNSSNNSSDKRKKKSREHHHHHHHQATKRQLPTVSEKESVERACGAVGA